MTCLPVGPNEPASSGRILSENDVIQNLTAIPARVFPKRPENYCAACIAGEPERRLVVFIVHSGTGVSTPTSKDSLIVTTKGVIAGIPSRDGRYLAIWDAGRKSDVWIVEGF